MTFGRILLLFLLISAIELVLLIQMGWWVGFWPTIGMIVLTGVAGSYLAKREGLGVWRQFNESLSRGGLPGRELIDGIILLCSGILLLTPGILTDLTGLVGLFPPTRALIRKYAQSRIERALRVGTMRVGFSGSYGPGGFSAPPGPAEGQWAGTPKDAPDYARRP